MRLARDKHSRTAIAENPIWYHTIELPGGVVTPGYVDWRKHARRILPADLSGLRALDVGTFDGFWAFEMESRGASVTAIDVERVETGDLPPITRERLRSEVVESGVVLGRGFQLAHRELESAVRRVTCDVMELTSEEISGPVDLVFIGAVLLHVRDPVGALERIREVLKPGGRLIALEPVSLRNTLLHPRTPMARFDTRRAPFNWWFPNGCALQEFVWAAGFEHPRHTRLFRPAAKPEMRSWYCALNSTVRDQGQ